jgi:hypothetical protein
VTWAPSGVDVLNGRLPFAVVRVAAPEPHTQRVRVRELDSGFLEHGLQLAPVQEALAAGRQIATSILELADENVVHTNCLTELPLGPAQ